MKKERITLLTILSKINFTQVISGVIGLGIAWIAYKQAVGTTHQETIIQKQDTAATKSTNFRQRSDSIHNLMFSKLDSANMKIEHLYQDNLKQDSALGTIHHH